MANARLEQVLKLLESEPDDAFLNHALAMEYLAVGEEEKAISAMAHLIKHHPEHTGTYYHLGFAYLRKGERDRAIEVWEEGITRCKELRKQHHLAELQSAYNELLFEEDD